MQSKKKAQYNLFRKTYPLCCRIISAEKLQHFAGETESVELFADIVAEAASKHQIPEYLSELVRLEFYVSSLITGAERAPKHIGKLEINQTLQLFENSWKNLYSLLDHDTEAVEPVRGKESIIIWKHPLNGKIKAKPVTGGDLLVLKVVLEEMPFHEVARQGDINLAAVEVAVVRALNEGIISGPQSGIKREFSTSEFEDIDPAFFSARIFTLQWHITQACDLHCRHCYDRSQYKSLTFHQGKKVLDDLAAFCNSRNVHGQLTFTGGNPLLHPHFEELYEEASKRGFSTAILGNPTSREQIERLKTIQPPSFYQVSLEGLEEHNDYMRGKGHFQRVLAFLDLLRELKVYSMVMLTLTRANKDQVLPLAEILRDRVDLFTFNRLSLVGEGANLLSVDPEEFPVFLRNYAKAAEFNPCLGLKENLLNVIYDGQKKPFFGGCTGYGCGAAFNFLALLADGTVHACRKFPSPLGSILDQSLDEIYSSSAAKIYRQGPEECRGCRLNPVCRGCLAVSYSQGNNIFSQKDRYCFFTG